MKKVSFSTIIDKVSELVVRTSRVIPGEVSRAIRDRLGEERSPMARKYLEIILENIRIAETGGLPVCQDTGLSVFFVRYGSDVTVDTGSYPDLCGVINEGLARGSRRGYLRNSVVDPIDRKNTGNNAPGIIHVIPGGRDEFEIMLLAKGFGSENTSSLRMLSPTAGREGIESFILETVSGAGSRPCPPVFVGVGIGGSFEKAAILSKMALCRMGEVSEHRQWESEILKKINGMNIGAGGFGGDATALDLRIETFPTHIAGLPVAVNISCWAHRFGSVKF